MQKGNENLKVTVQLTATNYNEFGDVLNAIDASAKLTKADAGRESKGDEDNITINASTCDKPTIEATYTSSAHGKGEVKTTLDLDLKAKVFDDDKEELIDALSVQTKLEKTDLGQKEGFLTQDWYRLKAVKNTESGCASIESNYSTRNISE